MVTYIVRRLLFMVVAIFAISIMSFVLIELPPGSALDDKISQMRQSGADVSAEQIRALEERYGLRDPIYVKYTKWVTHAVRGDFGQSFALDQPVKTLIWSRLAFSVNCNPTMAMSSIRAPCPRNCDFTYGNDQILQSARYPKPKTT